ncbi:GNAT family N-acetyltransferase [Marinomonas sp. IMCC 4694]|uniref:GNAT family N-acetyltransferase n=1 Tax=Marinomonas sp. IMCC 4694 TaxID=2605432 RepID=UPI0011E6EBBB|nr:GNAT family N-acetyltransferase [Marinomonas sp. IMCC 4694]TYL49143.1 GNAT family N-acetyltransferase [Marinomonas sp. IMCC 4694]
MTNPPYPQAERVPSLWFPLVKKFYQAHYPSGKPNKADPIWAIKNGGNILCAVRLKQCSPNQLLTAMVTAPSHRNQGLASRLLNDIKPLLTQTPSYCFAFNPLVDFYTRHHFTIISTDMLPEALKTRFVAYQAQGRGITAMRYVNPSC